MIEFVHGDMFATSADVRVNTVNCVGVMGAGVALAFKRRYPEMFEAYVHDCEDGLVRPGRLQVWRSLNGECVVNFPTKRHWRDRSRYEDIESGLDALRAYLSDCGPVSVTVPALGCGHGGLDWDRVSAMIQSKLDGVEAHIRVFSPIESRRAGRNAVEEMTADEVENARRLGFTKLSDAQTSDEVFVRGDLDSLKRSWIAVMPSRAPGKRELSALQTIASELVRSKVQSTVALLHTSQASEEVAQIFADGGIDTIMLLPFGILTRKSIVRRASQKRWRTITLASVGRPGSEWSWSFLARSAEILREHSPVVLISEPDPRWFVDRGASFWQRRQSFFLRYDGLTKDTRERLAELNALPIGRTSEGGSPNLENLLAAYRGDVVRSTLETQVVSPRPNSEIGSVQVSASQNDSSADRFDTRQTELFPELGVDDNTQVSSKDDRARRS